MDLTTQIDSIAFKILPDGRYMGFFKCKPETKPNGEEYQNIISLPYVSLRTSLEVEADEEGTNGTIELLGTLLSNASDNELFTITQITPKDKVDKCLSAEWEELINEITI